MAGVWGLPLVVVFFQHRAGDVGQLPSLAHAFVLSLRGQSLASVRGLVDVLAAELVAGMIIGSWLGIGTAIATLIPRGSGGPSRTPRSLALTLARQCGLGAGACSLVWCALGIAGLYRPIVAVAVTGLGLTLLVSMRARRDATPERRAPLAASECIALLLIAVPVGLAAIAALAPPTAKDALIYHRALPKTFVAGGGLVDVPFNIASFFALGGEMHGVWAMLAGGLVDHRVAEMAFGAVEFAFFPLLLLAVYGWGRQMGLDRAWALTAAALFASIPTAYTVATSAYIDLALALFVVLTIEAASEFWITGERTPLARLALCLGSALATKHTAIFLIVPMPLVILLRARQTDRLAGGGRRRAWGIVLGGAAALGCAVLIGGVWYARNWVRTGSPLFPFYLSLWPGHALGWDPERSALIQSLLSIYGGEKKGVIEYLTTPLRLSLLAQPEDPVYFEGVLGVSFLFALPLVIWAACRRALAPAAALASGVAALMFGQWLVSLEGVRYLLPALALVTLAVASAGDRAAAGPGSASMLRWALLLAAVPGQLVIASWFLDQNPVRVVLGGEDRASFLARRLDYYGYYQIVNAALPPASRVWLVDMRRDTYHIERPYFSDYLFEDYTLRKWIEAATTAEEMRDRARALGITHVLVRHDLLFDPARSPIVDDRRPPAVNAEKMRLLRSFLLDGTVVIRGDAKFLLVALPAPGRAAGRRFSVSPAGHHPRDAAPGASLPPSAG